MLLKQKRQTTNLDHEDLGGFTPTSDPLFESDWEVLVIKRDEQTGEFKIRTITLDEAAAA